MWLPVAASAASADVTPNIAKRPLTISGALPAKPSTSARADTGWHISGYKASTSLLADPHKALLKWSCDGCHCMMLLGSNRVSKSMDIIYNHDHKLSHDDLTCRESTDLTQPSKAKVCSKQSQSMLESQAHRSRLVVRPHEWCRQLRTQSSCQPSPAEWRRSTVHKEK